MQHAPTILDPRSGDEARRHVPCAVLDGSPSATVARWTKLLDPVGRPVSVALERGEDAMAGPELLVVDGGAPGRRDPAAVRAAGLAARSARRVLVARPPTFDAQPRIVLASDGAGGGRLIAEAADLAEVLHARVLHLHVGDEAGRRRALAEEMVLLTEMTGAEPGMLMADGNVGRAIVEHAARAAATLVILRRRGRGAAHGSICEHVARFAPAAVLIVPG